MTFDLLSKWVGKGASHGEKESSRVFRISIVGLGVAKQQLGGRKVGDLIQRHICIEITLNNKTILYI